MKTVTVSASSAYDVIIGQALLPNIGSYVASIVAPAKAAIISDSNVFPIYGKTVTESLSRAGFEVVHYEIKAGEASKNPDTYLSILNFLAGNHLSRSDVLVALGGGVVGDLTGFVAATYLRGVPYIQVPTSLLAMVDSSVGGKTAIDLPAGKNLVGAFYQPALVLCDIDVLDSLAPTYFRDGCAEVIKYGILYDPGLFSHLQDHGILFDREYVISRCIALKRDVVAEDEFDRGARQKLNLGHTIGHGIEAASNYSISHGYAVATGMAIVSRAAAAVGLCSTKTADKITEILKQFGLPVFTDCTADQLTNYALSDKKRFGKNVNLIVPKDIGECIILPTPISELSPFIEAGL